MRFLFKTLFRTAVIGTALSAAVIGGAAMIVGPDRVDAMADQIQCELESRFDANLDDPMVLRRQITAAGKQYQARIHEVRSDLASLRNERTRLEREQAISERVVALVDRDLEKLRPALASVDAEAAAGAPRAQLAAVSFEGSEMSVRRARAKLKEIERTKLAHSSRAADAQHNLKYLRSQEERFDSLLTQLEEEQAQLAAQTVQLKTEVESIARNERLIKLLESRQAKLDEMKSFDATSLDQITSLLERKRVSQELELDQLAGSTETVDYEAQAAVELSQDQSR